MFHYRVDFLNLLRQELEKYNVILDVYYGKPTPESLAKNDTGVLLGSTEIPSWCLRIGGKEVLLQIPPRRILGSNLIICMQENRLLINYALQLYTRCVGRSRFAFWGHGRNFQSQRATGLREALKRFLLRGSDWFFAYTNSSRDSLLESGYKAERITVFNNTIDTKKFSQSVSRVTDDEQRMLRKELAIPDGATIALFCGSIYPAKRIVELLDACNIIKKSIPEFHLICIGDGPSATEIINAEGSGEWIHFMGVQTGRQKAVAYSVSSAVLNPGLVGLHIVDSFSAGVPMITMDYEFHSPEFAYLVPGHNGLVSKADVGEYAKVAVELLTQPAYQKALAASARQSADDYSLTSMVDLYTSGILQAMQE